MEWEPVIWADAPESITQEVFRGAGIDGVPRVDPRPPAYDVRLLAGEARLTEGDGAVKSDSARDARM